MSSLTLHFADLNIRSGNYFLRTRLSWGDHKTTCNINCPWEARSDTATVATSDHSFSSTYDLRERQDKPPRKASVTSTVKDHKIRSQENPPCIKITTDMQVLNIYLISTKTCDLTLVPFRNEHT